MFEHKSTIIYPQTNSIVQAYPFEVIDGYDVLRIETYSVSLPFLKTFSTDGGPSHIDIIYGKGSMLLTEELKVRAEMVRKFDNNRLLKWIASSEERDAEIHSALTSERFRLWTSSTPSHKKCS